jgi:hypothetical protein
LNNYEAFINAKEIRYLFKTSIINLKNVICLDNDSTSINAPKKSLVESVNDFKTSSMMKNGYLKKV